MPRPFLTKVAWGRWWTYIDTRRAWKYRLFKLGPWWVVTVSYRKAEMPDGA